MHVLGRRLLAKMIHNVEQLMLSSFFNGAADISSRSPVTAPVVSLKSTPKKNYDFCYTYALTKNKIKQKKTTKSETSAEDKNMEQQQNDASLEKQPETAMVAQVVVPDAQEQAPYYGTSRSHVVPYSGTNVAQPQQIPYAQPAQAQQPVVMVTKTSGVTIDQQSHLSCSLAVLVVGFFVWPVAWGGTCLLCQKAKQTPGSRVANIVAIVWAFIWTLGLIAWLAVVFSVAEDAIDDTPPGLGDLGDEWEQECVDGASCGMGSYCKFGNSTATCEICPTNATCLELFPDDSSADPISSDALWDCRKNCEGYCDVMMGGTECQYNYYWTPDEPTDSFMTMGFCDETIAELPACQACPEIGAGETCADVINYNATAEVIQTTLERCESTCHPCLEYGTYDDDCCAVSPASCLDGYEYSAGEVCYDGGWWQAVETICTPIGNGTTTITPNATTP